MQKIILTFLRTLPFIQVLICVTMKSKAESIYTETEGGSVDISCKYPDGYQYSPMYFCRDPCTSSDVLIKCEKADTVVSKGRYMAVRTSSTCRFSVTIRNLVLKDSGVYYCGLDKWGTDKLTKVKLTVSKAATVFTQVPVSSQSFRNSAFSQYADRDSSTAVPTVSTHAPETRQNQSPNFTQLPPATTEIPDKSLCLLTFSASNTSTVRRKCSLPAECTYTTCQKFGHTVSFNAQKLILCGGIVTLCCVLAALVVIYRKTSTPITYAAPENQVLPLPPDQEDIDHVYDELLDVYSLAGPAIGDYSSVIYSTIQLPATADSDCSPYSLVAPH